VPVLIVGRQAYRLVHNDDTTMKILSMVNETQEAKKNYLHTVAARTRIFLP
jgi:hypothetical protein